MTTAIETTIAAKTEHQIPSALLQKKVQVTVVGCGGTGSAIAAGLPYLHQAMVALRHPHGLDVTLVDGDRISRTNCVRQPFSESEIGLHKATVLATRINLFWGLGWKGVPHFVDEGWLRRFACRPERDHPHSNLLELPLLAGSGQQCR
jgi:PRTRC genetic system ThiF family protein